jgi:hypothetical protein
MSRPWILGTGLGLLLALVQLLENALRAESHGLSLFPALLIWALQFGLVYASVQFAFRGLTVGLGPLRARTRSVALALAVAAGVCGTLGAILAAAVLDRPRPILLALSFFSSALVPLALGGLVLAMKYALLLRESLAGPGAKA